MKYLEDPRLALLTNKLCGCEVGNLVLDGRIEAFSCKRAGDDKKLSKMLEQQLIEELATSPGTLSSSPLGPLSESSTRTLLIDLIITMNASFPDYDFSALRPEQFQRNRDLGAVINHINGHLADLDQSDMGFNAASGKTFLGEIWKTAEDIIKLKESEVYRYIPDVDGDPFSDGTLWSFNYFFFNKSLKRIIFFTCIARSKLFSTTVEHMESLDEDSDVEREWGEGDDADAVEDFLGMKYEADDDV